MNTAQLAQTGDNAFINFIMWILFFFVFGAIYPKMMLHQIIWKLEKDTRTLEGWGKKTTENVIRKMSKHPHKPLRDVIHNFLEFFTSWPVDIDPYGVVKKLDRTVQDQKDRFSLFVRQHSDEQDAEQRANLEDGLGGAWAVTYMAKVVRHFVEIVKKYKNPYIAIPIQMQLPIIMDFAKAYMKGTETILNGDPIGDGIGPYVAAHMIGDEEPQEDKANEMVYAHRTINGRNCIVLKAKGPGSRVGNPGKTVEALIREHKPKRIITIDAAAKFEGEETGGVAEGVGVAMGGIGTERYYIEEEAMKHNVPIDAVIVKMRPEEAILSMREETLSAAPKAMEYVNQAIERAPEGSTVLVLGVGNSCGVGNTKASLSETERKVKENAKKSKKEEEEKKEEEKGFWDRISPFSSIWHNTPFSVKVCAF